MATIYKLIIEDDEGKTTVYPLSAGEISIGRKEGNTIRLMERNVSRRHARLLRNNGSVFIEDLDSYNGIRINGERINGRYEVKEGDLVEIGDYHLALQAAEIEEDVALPTKSDPNSQWPSAGTVPDFRLPDEIIAGMRKDAQQNRLAARDTLVDTPAPASIAPPAVMPVPTKTPAIQYADSAPTPESLQSQGQREPFVSPPPRGEDPAGSRPLPPFPGPGGMPGPTPLLARKDGSPAEADSRAQIKAQAPKKDQDALPTAPISVGPQRTATVPRLVCVSTTYAGKEFALTRPELIIGRVEDNDIVIEHRSVSRNHAKIVFDGRVHKIIDLQSANGILVNGEEYAMTDLRKGDLIELGHVKFRFVPAGETFAPTDEESREMREAGVQPPPEPPRVTEATHQLSAAAVPGTASSSPPPQKSQSGSQSKTVEMAEMPHSFDPSTAATVTDTPLSVMNLGPSTTPQVDPAPLQVIPPPLKRIEGGSRDERAPRDGRSEKSERADAGPRSSPDQRATEITPGAARTNGASGGHGASPTPKPLSEPTRPRIVRDDLPLREPKSSGMNALLVGGTLLIVAVLGVLLMMMRGPDGTEDKRLEELVKKGAYQEAIDYYKKHKFKDEGRADKLLKDAAAGLKEQERPKVDPQPPHEPQGAKDPDTNAKVVAEAAAPSDEPAGDDDAPSDESGASGPNKNHNARTLKRPITKAVQPIGGRTKTVVNEKATKARELSDSGKRALMSGDLSKAEDLLTKCVKLAPVPECYRNLGVLYGYTKDTAKSVENYRIYVKLAPDSPDVPKIRQWIEDPDLMNKK